MIYVFGCNVLEEIKRPVKTWKQFKALDSFKLFKISLLKYEL